MIGQTWISHLTELRNRLIFSIIIIIAGCVPVFIFYNQLFNWLISPVQAILEHHAKLLYANTVYEAFLVKVKFSLLFSFMITLPIHTINICGFIFPGLRKNEKLFLSVIFISIFLLGAAGLIYAYNLVLPGVFRFFLNSRFYPGFVGLLLNFSSNLFFIVQLLLCFLIIMQFPVVLISLLAFGLVTVKILLKSARFVVAAVFILAAIITPPDFVSQIAVAVPLVFLYFLTLGIWMFFGKIKKKNNSTSVNI